MREMKRKIRVLRYRMEMFLFPQKTKWFCPCCRMKVRSFVAGNYAKQTQRYDAARYAQTEQNVLCPVCRSLPRHRILALWCDAHRDRLRGAKVLYFAPEKSMMLWMKRNGISCTTADLNGKADLKLDIQDTGLSNGAYDVVFCNHVLEHVDDFKAALKELYRIIRPGGSLICSFPMDPKVELLDEDPEVQMAEGRRERFGQVDHQRVFGMKADRLLEEAGFAVERIDGVEYPKEILPDVGPADYDMNILFHCKKK